MAEIKLTAALVALLKKRHVADKVLLLVADDGGGKYSLQGGACTIGSVFNLVVLDDLDPDYPIPLKNDAGIKLYSSQYNLYFLESGLVMDVKDYRITLRDDAHQFENDLELVEGSDIIEAFQNGIKLGDTGC